MRKLTTGVALSAAVAAGAATVVAITNSSSSYALPSPPRSCGQFTGVGPTPSCSYTVDPGRVVITLRNNSTRRTPVRCDLTPSGLQRPIDSTTLGPGGRGSVSAGLNAHVPRVLLIDCRTVTRGAPEVARRLTLSVHGPRTTSTPSTRPWQPRTTSPRPRPTRSVPTQSPPQRSHTTISTSSPRSQPRPSEPSRSRPAPGDGGRSTPGPRSSSTVVAAPIS